MWFPCAFVVGTGRVPMGVDITPEEIYARLKAGELPKTSLPAGEDIERIPGAEIAEWL